MPYKSVDDLPDNITNVLPIVAQRIWLEAFNRGYYKFDSNENRARRYAWGAVKNAGYNKSSNGKWKKLRDQLLDMSAEYVLRR